jgi:hypothetical protein
VIQKGYTEGFWQVDSISGELKYCQKAIRKNSLDGLFVFAYLRKYFLNQEIHQKLIENHHPYSLFFLGYKNMTSQTLS